MFIKCDLDRYFIERTGLNIEQPLKLLLDKEVQNFRMLNFAKILQSIDFQFQHRFNHGVKDNAHFI